MSEVMNPNDPTGPTNPIQAPSQVAPQRPLPAERAAPTTTAVARPGLVTFAAVIMFILAAFQVIFAFVEFNNAAFLANTAYGTFSNRLWLWGIVDLIVAAIAVYAGYDLLRGGTFGRIVGLIAAAIVAARWFFYLPAEPWTAVLMIALAVLIIYGLVSHAEYFDSIHVK